MPELTEEQVREIIQDELKQPHIQQVIRDVLRDLVRETKDAAIGRPPVVRQV